MKHRIDPKIDCVFKALLGSEENRNLLIHFLNAVLAGELSAPIATVDLLNPYNDKEFLDDKLSIVDVKAKDDKDRIYQIEIQLVSYSYLPARILYTWADIYSQQLQSGNDYLKLKPTYSIWLLGENLIQDDKEYAHTYQLRDAKGKTLIDHGGIWLLELKKFAAQQIENDQQRWLQFFKKGDQFDDETNLPDWMNTPEMRQAMSTLRQFSEKERNYHAYQARQNYLRQQRTMQLELEEALQRETTALKEKEAAMQRETVALKEKEAALAEIERLKALLNHEASQSG
ncbi:transposase [Gammaproteobacteria bacterium]